MRNLPTPFYCFIGHRTPQLPPSPPPPTQRRRLIHSMLPSPAMNPSACFQSLVTLSYALNPRRTTFAFDDRAVTATANAVVGNVHVIR